MTDSDGTKVMTAAEEGNPAGRGQVRFDIRVSGWRLGAGIYLARLTSLAGAATSKFLVARERGVRSFFRTTEMLERSIISIGGEP